MPILSVSALALLGGWLGKKIFDEAVWDRGKGHLKKAKQRQQWNVALESAANVVRGRYPETATELFDEHFLAKVIAPAGAEILHTPIAAADLKSVASEFRGRFRGLKTGVKIDAGSPLLQRADAEVEPAIALFFESLEDELANHSELVQAWRDRSLETIKKDVKSVKKDLKVLLAAKADQSVSATVHVDRALNDAVARLLARRYFPGDHKQQDVRELAVATSGGEYGSASPGLRSKTLRLCCRLLVHNDLAAAKGYLAQARSLSSASTPIEDAWVTFAEGDKDAALRTVRAGEGPDWQSATFAMLSIRDGQKAAADWFAKQDIDPAASLGPQLAAPILTFVALNRWDDVQSMLPRLNVEHYSSCPVFHLVEAASLARSITTPRSDDYLLGAALPLTPHALLTQTRLDWQDIARAAVSAYDKAAAAARACGLDHDARRFAELALWISFETPALREDAVARVMAAVQHRTTALDVVPFAAAHGVPLPSAQLRALLAEREATGGLDAIDVRAALALAETPSDALALIDRRRGDIETALGISNARFLEVQATLYAHGRDAAARRLEAVNKDLDDSDRDRLTALVADADEKSAVLLALFEKSGEPNDLRNLARHLASTGQWSAAADRFLQLFSATHFTTDAEVACETLARADRFGELPEFFDANWDRIDHTPMLRSYRAMALSQQGKLSEARTLLEELLAGDANIRDEQLYSNVLIESGDWDSLVALVDRIWRVRAERPARHLVWAARAAAILDLSARALALLREACARDDADAVVFASAAHIVFEIGRESEVEELPLWLRRAVELSGDDGPMQQVDIQFIAKEVPAWRRRESEVVEALYSGQMPLFIAGRRLGSSLGDLILGNALRSQGSNDARRRAVVPVRFGGRPPQALQVVGRIVLDITTILVLESIGLLDRVLRAGLDLIVPSGTLNALFLERQKARFHQPSRISEAEKLISLVTERRITPAPVRPPSNEMAKDVGAEIAQLIEVARGQRGLFVRPPPITRPGDFSERPVDIGPFADILTDTRSVFAMLRDDGRLSTLVEAQAAAYVPKHDPGWPEPNKPSADAPLILDSLALHSLYAAGLLEPLARYGPRILIHPEAIEEATALVRHKATLETYYARVEAARTALRDALAEKRLRMAPQYREEGDDELPIHPTMQLLHISEADWVIIDDRALNIHAHTSPTDADPVPVATSLDLIDCLLKRGLIDENESRHARHRMRESAFIFVPMALGELEAELAAASVVGGALKETRYLRIAREALLRPATVDSLKLDKEGPVLDAGYRSAGLALFRTWRIETDVARRRAQADWLVSYLSALETLGEAKMGGLRGEGLAPILAPALLPPFGQDESVIAAHQLWIEEVFWPSVSERPDIVQPLIRLFREMLRDYMSNEDDVG